MAGTSTWSAPVACLGLAACLGTFFYFPTLLQMTSAGEISVVKAFSVVLGAALLLVASVRLLIRRKTHGKMFAAADGLLLISLLWIPFFTFSYWVWFAALAALAGAAIGFRTPRDHKPAV